MRFGAALAEDIDRLWEFLENGQDVNERGGHFNKSALEEAADNGGASEASSSFLIHFKRFQAILRGFPRPRCGRHHEKTCEYDGFMQDSIEDGSQRASRQL